MFLNGLPAVGAMVVMVDALGQKQAVSGVGGSFTFASVDLVGGATLTANYQQVVSQPLTITADNRESVRLILPDEFFPIAVHLSESVDCTVFGRIRGHAEPLFARVDQRTQLGAESLLPSGAYLFHARVGIYEFEIQIPRAEVQVVRLKHTEVAGPTVLHVVVPPPETSPMAVLNVLDVVTGRHLEDVVVRCLPGDVLLSGGSPLALRLSALESVVEVRAMGYTAHLPDAGTLRIAGHEASVTLAPAGISQARVQALASADYPDGAVVRVRHKLLGMRRWVLDEDLRVGADAVVWQLPAGSYRFECFREGAPTQRASVTLHAGQSGYVQLGSVQLTQPVNGDGMLTIRGLPAWACQDISVCGDARERLAVPLAGGDVKVPIRADTKYLEIGGDSQLYLRGCRGDMEWRIGQGVPGEASDPNVTIRVVPVALQGASKVVLVARGRLREFVDASEMSMEGLAIVRHGHETVVRSARSKALTGTGVALAWPDGAPVTGKVTMSAGVGGEAYLVSIEMPQARVVRVPPCEMGLTFRVVNGTKYSECVIESGDGWSGSMVVR